MDSEKILIERLRRGDEAAFRQVFEAHKDRALNTLLGMVGSRSDAEDLVQEVFVEVWQSISGFQGNSKLSTWIYRISVTKALNHLRFKKAKKRFAFVVSLFGGGAEAVEKSDFLNPSLLLERSEEAARIAAAIDRLPEKQRTAFVLRQAEGLAYQEIGEVMQVSVASVESLLFRAKQNLQIALKKAPD